MSNQVAENRVDFGTENKNLLIFEICYILIGKYQGIAYKCSPKLSKTHDADSGCNRL